jgi:hypothetical protein
VLGEVGVDSASYATLKRRLPSYAQPSWRRSLAAASARHARLGPASLVLYDVWTLYFETDAGDGFGEPGFCKQRRLDPQIALGLLTDASGFALSVEAVEGNKAETATMLPVINAFKAAHQFDRRHRRCRRWDDLAGQPGRAAGCPAVLHPGTPVSRCCPTWSANGTPNTPMKRSLISWC